MTGYPKELGVFQCGLQVFGRSTDATTLFAWVMCFDYATGADAAPLSGSRLAMALDVSGKGSATELTGYDTPRDDARVPDIHRIFPTHLWQVAAQCGRCRPRPDMDEMLAIAQATTE